MPDLTLFQEAGAVALAASLVLIYYYYRSRLIWNEVYTVHPYKAAELRRMCSEDFDAVVEVEGELSCDKPIIAPASGVPCCWYRTRVDTEVWTGKNRYWHQEFDETLSAVFKVTDETGYVLVEAVKAEVSAEPPYILITETREPWFESVGYSSTGRYRITEEYLLPTGHIFVLGQASCCQDAQPDSDVLIHYPSRGYTEPNRRLFIVDRKSKRDILNEETISLKICLWMSVIGLCFAAYCGLTLLGVLPAP